MIWAISDLHFDPMGDKPMSVFGDNWLNHEEKIISNWFSNVKEDDLVLIPGDISWGLKLEEAESDLRILDSLPGTKALIKGNHDYWWSSMNKMQALNLKTIKFIYNDHLVYDDYVIYGTRGWDSKDSLSFDNADLKIYNRELNRLKLSFESYPHNDKKKIAMIHYPPYNQDKSPNDFLYMMEEKGISICIYGHLHAQGLGNVLESDDLLGLKLKCVSSDYLNFKLALIK